MIQLGRRPASVVYGLFLLLAFVTIAVGVALGRLPALTLISMVMLVPSTAAFIGSYRFADDMKGLAPFLGLNVLINILTPILVAVGLSLADRGRVSLPRCHYRVENRYCILYNVLS